ncbi:attachment protein [Pseudomonas nitroreducens]|uniref:attachment protein n=1 Tax=Pseudomonas nitroreducens TaxID=46680 RepID=UPI0023F8D452|nr:attachment protein [Pseudomonas nitroreducens]WEW97816.1 attachment protein [Pseudomonas nitroreducens]
MVRQWLLAVMVLLAAGQVAAKDYYWENNRNQTGFKTAMEACYGGKVVDNDVTYMYEFVVSEKGDSGYCRWNYRSDGKFSGTINFHLRGDSCPSGLVYSNTIYGCACPPGQEADANGVCVALPSCDSGKEFLTRGSNFPATTVSGRVYVLSSPPSSVCSAGCQYTSASSKASSCYLVSGSTDTGFCNYSMTSDGERCSGDDSPGPDVGDPPNPDDTSETPNQPSDPDDPGCAPGQAWSGSACVPEPTGEGDEGDGTDDGEGDDSGDPCDIEGDCWDEGGGESGNGSGNGSGSGNGEGDGSDEGDGEDDGEGECDPSQGYVCGDGKGPESTLSPPDAGSWDKANEEWDQRLDEAKKELKDKVKANVDQMKNAFNLQISAGGGQLPCDSISVWGKSYRFCVADYGEQLINLRLALLLMAAVIAALIILKD